MKIKTPIIIIALFGLVFLIFTTLTTKPPLPINQPPSPTQIPIAPTTINKPGRIIVSGIQINDIAKSPVSTNNEKDILFSRTPTYDLVYLQSFEEFIIHIRTPSPTDREKAEQDFINKLGITKEEACDLVVTVGQLYSAEFPQSSNTKLSFCR